MLVVLILFQQSIQNGLVTSFIGAIRNQSAPVLVFPVDGQRVIQTSVITPDLEAKIRATDGVGEVGWLGQSTFSVVADETTVDTTIIGYQSIGFPTTLVEGRLPTANHEAVASTVDVAEGFGLGQTVSVEPGGREITIVGLADSIQLSATPTLFVVYDEFLATVASSNPDARAPFPNIVVVEPTDGVTPDELVTAINSQSLELDALTREVAAATTHGVAQVRQSFRIVFALFGLVVPCVIGLFFLIITFQKSAALTLLRAIGAPARYLALTIMIQAMIIVAVGYGLGVAIYAPLSRLQLGTIFLQFETRAVIVWGIIVMILGVASSLFAIRRIMRIDPIAATQGGGQG